MTTDDELLVRFHARLSAIEALVKDPPPRPTRVRGSTLVATKRHSLLPAVGLIAILTAFAVARLMASVAPGDHVGASAPLSEVSASTGSVAALEVTAFRIVHTRALPSGLTPGLVVQPPRVYEARVTDSTGSTVALGRIDDGLTELGSVRILRSIVLPAGSVQIEVTEYERTVNLDSGLDIDSPTGSCRTDLRLAPGLATWIRATFDGATCAFDAPRAAPLRTPLPSLTPQQDRLPSVSPSAVSPDSVTETIGRFSVTHPASWTLVAGPTVADPFGVPIFYLSTEPLTVGPCFTPNPSGEYQGCADPLVGQHLSPTGILITAVPNPGLAEIFPPQVNDIAPPDEGCRLIGGDEEREVVVNAAVLVACLRGPELGELEAGFAEVVASMFASSPR